LIEVHAFYPSGCPRPPGHFHPYQDEQFTEAFLETLGALGQPGRANRPGAPNPLQLAILLRTFRHEFRLSRPPYPVQQALYAALTLVRWLLGCRAGTVTRDVPS
jgi:hypothetical protein